MSPDLGVGIFISLAVIVCCLEPVVKWVAGALRGLIGK
jgi:hypothetical protein